MHFAGSVCWGLLFGFFFFFTCCYLFFNLLVVWPCMSVVQRVVLQSCVFRASALVRHSETLRRRHGVVDKQSHKRIYKMERGGQRVRTALTPAAGMDLAQTLAVRCLNIQYEHLPGVGTQLTWASRTLFYPQTSSLSLCHPYRHYKKKREQYKWRSWWLFWK